MKCVEGHEMDDAHKRCGSCGKEPQQAGDSMLKCHDCDSEQTGDHNFCTDCGSALMKADDAVFEELEAFWRDRQIDDFTVERGDHGDVDGLLKSLDSGENDVYDAAPLIKASIEGQQHVYDAAVSIGRRQVEIERGQVLIARGLSRIHDMLKARDVEQGREQNRPGRSRTATVTQVPRRPLSGVESDETVPLSMFKAADVVAFEAKGLLEDGDSTKIEFWANRGLTIAALAQEDPALAHRLQSAVTRSAN